MVKQTHEKSAPAPVDVTETFQNATASYLELTEKIQNFTRQANQYSAEEILEICHSIRKEHSELATQDNLLIEIVEFAGAELQGHPLLKHHQEALLKAKKAYDLLYNQVNGIRNDVVQLIANGRHPPCAAYAAKLAYADYAPRCN